MKVKGKIPITFQEPPLTSHHHSSMRLQTKSRETEGPSCSILPRTKQKKFSLKSLGDQENSVFSPSRESCAHSVFTDFVGTLLADQA